MSSNDGARDFNRSTVSELHFFLTNESLLERPKDGRNRLCLFGAAVKDAKQREKEKIVIPSAVGPCLGTAVLFPNNPILSGSKY